MTEGKTLAELDVQVGDVVELVSGECVAYHLIGETYTVRDGAYGIKAYRDGGHVSLECFWKFRLISRAHPARAHSPVREVVTTRKQIVPGVYGHLRVELHPAIGMAYISTHVAGKSDHSIPMGHKDLSAMIATLTLIRDAMEDGQ